MHIKFLFSRFKYHLKNKNIFLIILKVFKFIVKKKYFTKRINLDTANNEYNLSLDSLFIKFNSDKGSKHLDNDNVNTPKNNIIYSHNYSPFYEKHFEKIKKNKLKILEIGTLKGASTASFYYYFQNSELYCIDVFFSNFLYKSKRIKFFELDFTNTKEVNNFCNQFNNFFDIIIDDGSHWKSHIINNLNNFSKTLKINGFYIIEDYKRSEFIEVANDYKKEYKIEEILEFIDKKQYFKSKLLNESEVANIINNFKILGKYEGSWIDKKHSRNISNISFLKKDKKI